MLMIRKRFNSPVGQLPLELYFLIFEFLYDVHIHDSHFDISQKIIRSEEGGRFTIPIPAITTMQIFIY